jgi:hypothetical protein
MFATIDFVFFEAIFKDCEVRAGFFASVENCEVSSAGFLFLRCST